MKASIKYLTVILGVAALSGLTSNAKAQENAPPLRGLMDGAADEDVLEGTVKTNGRELSSLTRIYSEGRRQGPQASFAQKLQRAERVAALGQLVAPDPMLDVFDGDTLSDRPEGLRLRSFLFYPELSAGWGYTDNASSSASGEGSSFYRLEGFVALRSDWDRHYAEAYMEGSLQSFIEDTEDDQPQVGAGGQLRLDLKGGFEVGLQTSYSLTREERASAENASETGRTDLVHDLRGAVSVEKEIGPMLVSAQAGIERTFYDEGSDRAEEDRDNSLFDASLRLSMNAGGMVAPFVEGGVLLRKYDRCCAGGFNRDATGYHLRTGFNLDRGPKLRGEVSVGWREERPEDHHLPNLQGLLFDTAFVWSPTRRDTVSASVVTYFDSSHLEGVSGSILYSGELQYARQITQDLVADASLSYSYRDYKGMSGSEREMQGSLGVLWAFSKSAALTARYTYSNFRAAESPNSFHSNTIEAGLRIRH
ncbi:outer membrane beta-barrel protein [Flexibacterium corallicola]|uniref:outer membrane beta-barrel protein n=1 Tax=Flexibacterium corallicola TaxID=3037259 RepID=UPI00286F7585|nr:outer membrane beta-barrel protein [Pseudovibrio sp. M1P-2-3]